MQPRKSVWLTGLAAVVVGACDSTGPENQPRELTVTTYSQGASTPVAVLEDGHSLAIATWTSSGTPSGTPTQTLYMDRDVRTRLIYSNGVPSKIYDETTGDLVVIEHQDNRVDFLAYNASGVYLGGQSVVYEGGELRAANVLSKPFFTGQLSATSNALSFAASAEGSTGLDALRPVPAQVSAYFGQLIDDAASPEDAKAMLTLAGLVVLANQPPSSAVSPAVNASLVQASLASAQIPIVVVGVVAVGVALALEAGLLTGVGMWLDSCLDDQFNNSVTGASFSMQANGSNGAGCGLGTSALDDLSVGESAAEVVSNWWDEITSSGAPEANQSMEITEEVGDPAQDEVPAYIPPSAIPSPTSGPPSGSSTLTGAAVDQTSTVYDLTGTVSGTGEVTLNGQENGRSVSINGNVTPQDASGTGTFTGTYSGSPGSGTLNGETGPFGACQATQASGGQGTFVKMHAMGTSSGSVSFRYEAYSIPDAFEVKVGGSTVVQTGMISGSGTQSFQLNGSSQVVVAVSAPQSGTAWTYNLTCPS